MPGSSIKNEKTYEVSAQGEAARSSKSARMLQRRCSARGGRTSGEEGWRGGIL